MKPGCGIAGAFITALLLVAAPAREITIVPSIVNFGGDAGAC
jgi:hypothetical protein